jgi:uncharacterized damage-inducible protein DinB
MHKTSLLTSAGLLWCGALAAQQPAANDPAALLRGGFDETAAWVVKAAEMVPADKYGFKPAATVRSFGQLIGHIADGQNYYCARGAGDPVQWVQTVEQGSQDKAVLVQKLKESIALCTAAHARAGAAGPLIANYGHTSLHYGNVITYLRLLGLVPPSS